MSQCVCVSHKCSTPNVSRNYDYPACVRALSWRVIRCRRRPHKYALVLIDRPPCCLAVCVRVCGGGETERVAKGHERTAGGETGRPSNKRAVRVGSVASNGIEHQIRSSISDRAPEFWTKHCQKPPGSAPFHCEVNQRQRRNSLTSESCAVCLSLRASSPFR